LHPGSCACSDWRLRFPWTLSREADCNRLLPKPSDPSYRKEACGSKRKRERCSKPVVLVAMVLRMPAALGSDLGHQQQRMLPAPRWMTSLGGRALIDLPE